MADADASPASPRGVNERILKQERYEMQVLIQ